MIPGSPGWCYKIFIYSLLLISPFITYIFCNISQVILGSLSFSLLWMIPETLIIPLLDVFFYPPDFASYQFTQKVTLREYLHVEFCLISSKILILPTKWSTCYRSFLMLIVSLGIPYTPSISAASVMYAYVSMISLVDLPICSVYCKANHFSNYFPHDFSNCGDSPMVHHRSIFQ